MLSVLLIYQMYFLRVILTLFRPVADTVLDMFHWIICGETKPLPRIDNKILLMSATKLARKIRRRELSAVEVTEAYVNRIKAVQPIVNAYVDDRFEDALADAKAIDKMLELEIKTEQELAETKPLLGVPFTCKEIIGVKDLAQTWGIMKFKDRKAPEDSVAATLYKKAGAIPLVVTNIPSMSAWWDTANPVFGATKNPYNNNRTVGGSSGGEAALLSSAASVIGIGSDLAGSIRIPASFCGIYGHKPTTGVISNRTVWPENPKTSKVVQNIEKFICTGPMCRYSEDLPLLLKVLAGDKYKELHLDKKVDFNNFTVYYMEEFPGYLLAATPDVKASVRKAVKYFEEKHGSITCKLEMEELKYAFYIWQSKLFEGEATFRSAEPEIQGFFNELLEFFKYILGMSEYDLRLMYHGAIEFLEKDNFYEKCIAMHGKVQTKLDEILNGNAILILPVHPEPPPHSIVTIPKFENIAYTCVVNVLGLPATAVPAGQSNGLPVGIQVLAKKNNDHLTIAAAAELDKAFGGWKSPSPILV